MSLVDELRQAVSHPELALSSRKTDSLLCRELTTFETVCRQRILQQATSAVLHQFWCESVRLIRSRPEPRQDGSPHWLHLTVEASAGVSAASGFARDQRTAENVPSKLVHDESARGVDSQVSNVAAPFLPLEACLKRSDAIALDSIRRLESINAASYIIPPPSSSPRVTAPDHLGGSHNVDYEVLRGRLVASERTLAAVMKDLHSRLEAAELRGRCLRVVQDAPLVHLLQELNTLRHQKSEERKVLELLPRQIAAAASRNASARMLVAGITTELFSSSETGDAGAIIKDAGDAEGGGSPSSMVSSLLAANARLEATLRAKDAEIAALNRQLQSSSLVRHTKLETECSRLRTRNACLIAETAQLRFAADQLNGKDVRHAVSPPPDESGESQRSPVTASAKADIARDAAGVDAAAMCRVSLAWLQCEVARERSEHDATRLRVIDLEAALSEQARRSTLLITGDLQDRAAASERLVADAYLRATGRSV